MKQYMRLIGDQQKDVSLEMDFTDSEGTRHPRNVLFNWTPEELWEVLQITVIEEE